MNIGALPHHTQPLVVVCQLLILVLMSLLTYALYLHNYVHILYYNFISNLQ